MQNTPNSFSIIRSAIPSMTKSEKEVARWITENPEKLMNMTLSQISNTCGVSDTTVLRVCRAAGFDGFTDAKLSLIRDIDSPVSQIGDVISEDNDISTIFLKVVNVTKQGLSDTQEVFDVEELEKAVELIENANKILFVGVGPSGMIARDFHSKITRIYDNKYCVACDDSYSSLLESSLLGQDDLVIAVSVSGMSKLPIHIITEGKRHGANSIAITGNPKSKVATLSDAVLLAVHRTSWVENMVSRVSDLAIIEALYVILFIRNSPTALNNERIIENALAYEGVWFSENIKKTKRR
jgi:DNA-binding MurR/RpiR family transcriptional regulator